MGPCSTLARPVADVRGGIVDADVVFDVGVEQDDDLAATPPNQAN